jgi:nicotinate-nucleotide pyrophosphorylase (carboxylating)
MSFLRFVGMNYEDQLNVLVTGALKEDIGEGDHSTLCCIPADARGRAALKIKQEGILAGVAVAEHIFHFREPAARFSTFKKDGDEMKPGLQCERLVLNCMQRMCGIATLTRRYAEKLKGFKTRLLDTRKTTPNFRLLEKRAVEIGGGQNHRHGLYDMIMLKDNHIDYCGGISMAIERAFDYVQRYKPDLKIEIETRSLRDIEEVMAAGRGKVNRIMLDNFSADLIRQALDIIGNEFETEASGGITLDNIQEFAATGVDFVSVGALIHQATSVDLSLKAVI